MAYTNPTTTSNGHIRFRSLPTRHSNPAVSTPAPKSGVAHKPAQDFDAILRPKQMKSMAGLDKEEELRLVKSHREKVKKVGAGVLGWVVGLRKKYVTFSTTPITHIIAQEQLSWQRNEQAESVSDWLLYNGEALALRSLKEAEVLEQRDVISSAPAPGSTPTLTPASAPTPEPELTHAPTKPARPSRFKELFSPPGSLRVPQTQPLTRATTDLAVKRRPGPSSHAAHNMAHRAGEAMHQFNDAAYHALEPVPVQSHHGHPQNVRRANTNFDGILNRSQMSTWQHEDNTHWQQSVRGKAITGLGKAKQHLRRVKQGFGGSSPGYAHLPPSSDYLV
ncbi:hypothetical protein T440DRAFT_554669 [Plenodomus tracheiphilus IPT5]|uniref:Uncharacterized protein n=1 Tax=Plenodomus tracheiphilus IPT5 TaxID=1408161 RepID=A0A6A7B6D3_9PLEO|nr:hypothetical protein T440DRAFT_554669 [Plenodomus tracheiphilus IPT5]